MLDAVMVVVVGSVVVVVVVVAVVVVVEAVGPEKECQVCHISGPQTLPYLLPS